MAGKRSFRFGVQFSGAATAEAWREKARRAEALGYDVFIMPDHFGGQFAIGPALAVVAEATSTLRIATLVLQNDLRHPALVAMEAATLDVLSGGRFELGLGAGGSWMPDYEWTGIPFDAPGQRIERLEESIAVIKGLFDSGPLSFNGAHYTITDFEGMPKPVQQPRIPILIGGGGPRLLSLAAREADIISIFPQMRPGGGQFHDDELSREAVTRKVDLIRSIAGARFADIELNVLTQRVTVTNERHAEIDRLSGEWNIASDVLSDAPQILVGDVAEIADHLFQCREELAISYFVVFGQFMETFAPVIDRLAKH
jgi:probable F420-dependent oxidoreductase